DFLQSERRGPGAFDRASSGFAARVQAGRRREVVETVVAAPSGPSATSSMTSSIWITIELLPLCREAVGASRVPGARSKNAGGWRAKPLQTGPAVRERAPLAFAVRTRDSGGPPPPRARTALASSAGAQVPSRRTRCG